MSTDRQPPARNSYGEIQRTYASLNAETQNLLSELVVDGISPSTRRQGIVSIAPALVALSPEAERELVDKGLFEDTPSGGRLTPAGIEVAHHAKLMRTDPGLATSPTTELETAFNAAVKWATRGNSGPTLGL